MRNRGFTLVEILVATAIFMMVMLAAIGSLFVTSNSAKKSKALRTAMDNVNFSMSTMSRTLRLGYKYYCVPGGSISLPINPPSTNDCNSGESAIAFVPANTTTGEADTMFRRSTNIVGSHSVQKCDRYGTCIDLTSPDVDVTDLKFYVKGSADSSSNDFNQPSVFITMKGEVTVNGTTTPFALQTLASERTAE